ncbi:MAG: YdiU family protein [Mariprofundus sp.]
MQEELDTHVNSLHFDNRFTRLLPADPETDNFPRQVFHACYSRVKPAPVSQPRLIACADEVAELLDLPASFRASADFTDLCTGNRLLPGMDPHAVCYGGHQFGHWAGQLGDGRTINLGEAVNSRGEYWMLQLKGSGATPYSRTADGLAVLRSSIREFLCSEAMFHLGVPTTRALSLALSGDRVMRDMFYDGHAALEKGAIVCRVAPSFTRFGSFQIFASRKDTKTLQQLLDHTITSDFPHLGKPDKATYLRWFEEVCQSTAALMVHWMRVGFVHGVMNTDNMSVLGLTIDYGPYGWLEVFDPDWTPNTTDREMRRYRFNNQAAMAGWNLARLGEAMLPLIGDAKPLQALLYQYSANYQAGWQAMMANKLGLQHFNSTSDIELVEELEQVLTLTETDMTIFYRKLADLDTEQQADHTHDAALLQPLHNAFYAPDEVSGAIATQIAGWLRRYIHRLQQDERSNGERKTAMNRHNPKYVLRNWLAQVAIDKAENGDYSEIHHLHALLKHPYDEQPEHESYAAKRPDWARDRAGCSMLSCSS